MHKRNNIRQLQALRSHTQMTEVHNFRITHPDLNHRALEEHKGTDSLWEAFDGGKTEYSSMKELGYASGFQYSLFQISNYSAYTHIRELYNFQQDDLNNNDVMVLDAYNTIWMYIGFKSNMIE